jgi:hypothetical protein
MANVFYNVTLSTAEAGSGPNYDVSYSNDCVTYLPATPSTVTLESVGSQATITIPDTTQCVKLTNINSNCVNSVSSSVSPTTTTTTTAAPTTTTTAAPTTTTTTFSSNPCNCVEVNITSAGGEVATFNCYGVNENYVYMSAGTYYLCAAVIGGLLQADIISGAGSITPVGNCKTGACPPATTTTTTIARRFDWNFIESGGARGEMFLYINGAQVESRTITSSGFYNVNVGDTIYCAVAAEDCGQAANAYCIGIINDASCATGNTSFISSTYTVLSTDTFITLSMYATCDVGCV